MLDAALETGTPVFLIKSMPGLESRFALKPYVGPLVQVIGSAATAPPDLAVHQSIGPLELVGFDWVPGDDGVEITLHWRPDASLEHDYTTTVQLFDVGGEKVGQDDRPPGGVYYPTSLWQPGETLLDRHTVTLADIEQPASMLVGLYRSRDLTPLAPALTVDLP